MTSSSAVQQQYKYFLVLDFEATCDEFCKIPDQEIIEFPVLKVNSSTLKVEGKFHEYVRPRIHKQLTPFCTKLTGITQSTVDSGRSFDEVMSLYDSWHRREVGNSSYLVVTCGDWDLKTVLPLQCRREARAVPDHCMEWHNVKKAFSRVLGLKQGIAHGYGMMTMLAELGIQHVGRHHSGIDDCRNISNILCECIRRGVVVAPTGTVPVKNL